MPRGKRVKRKMAETEETPAFELGLTVQEVAERGERREGERREREEREREEREMEELSTLESIEPSQLVRGRAKKGKMLHVFNTRR